jgi:two-component system, LuxR family, response regulator FixJ
MPKTDLESDEVFLVDDDATLCELLSAKLNQAGFCTTSFTDAQSFVDAARRRTPACVVLDIYMPKRSGIDLVKELRGKKYPAPIIVMSAKITVPLAVEAMVMGAFDIIEKPFEPDAFVASVHNVIERWRQKSADDSEAESFSMNFPGAQRLTAREQEVLAEIVAASSNKEAGRHLGLSPRTIEVHRAHIMMKLCTKNTVDLVRFVLSSRHSD